MAVENFDAPGGSELQTEVSWKLLEATVVGLGKSGQVFVVSGLTLNVTEGRSPQFVPIDPVNEGLAESWEYQFNFYEVGGPEFESSEQFECKAAVLGNLEDGRTIKIFGKGYVGRDNHGRIEGTFFRPPLIDFSAAEEPIKRLMREE